MSIQKKFLVHETYTTESGFVFKEFELSYHSWGTLNKKRRETAMPKTGFMAFSPKKALLTWIDTMFYASTPRVVVMALLDLKA